MPQIRVVYISSAAPGLTDTELESILSRSRSGNARLGITGILVEHEGTIIQVLEGEAEHVDALLKRIARDPRHTSMIELLREPVDDRLFADWSMGFIDTSTLDPDEREVLSDGIGALHTSEGSRTCRLLRSFAARAR